MITTGQPVEAIKEQKKETKKTKKVLATKVKRY